MSFKYGIKMLLRLKGIGNIEKFSDTSIQNSNINFNSIQFCSNTLELDDHQ